MMMIIILFFIINTISIFAFSSFDLTKVETLTFQKNYLTTSRRVQPMNQLMCEGYYCKYNTNIQSVQCKNTGVNEYNDVQWDCKTQLPYGISFEKLRVSCEGFRSSDDFLKLRGSCGLIYSLQHQVTPIHQIPPIHQVSPVPPPPVQYFTFEFIILYFCIIIIFFCILSVSTGNTRHRTHSYPSYSYPSYSYPSYSYPSYSYNYPTYIKKSNDKESHGYGTTSTR